ncbi:hypothetical protein BYT27DRAFT_7200210 [Phlegmacium glaucopus]|nr:hypothetical protein BYT27DRAFT_7200210 [Phlegmacium glaucopus]
MSAEGDTTPVPVSASIPLVPRPMSPGPGPETPSTYMAPNIHRPMPLFQGARNVVVPGPTINVVNRPDDLQLRVHVKRRSDRPSNGSDSDESDIDEDRVPISFGDNSQIMNSNFTLLPSQATQGFINPETLRRPRNTFLSFGDRSGVYNSNFMNPVPSTGIGETDQSNPARPRPRQQPNSPFVAFGDATTTVDSTFFQIGDHSHVSMCPPSTNFIKSPFRGFHSWNDAEKIKALNAVHALQTVIQTLVNDDDDSKTEKQVNLLSDSLSSYMEFLNYLIESRLPERAGSLQARAISLVVLAGVAIVLGVLQLLTLTFMAVAATERNESDIVGRVINIFAFCGVSFDALGTMFTLWTFRSLFLTISKIEKIVLENQNLNAKIHFTLDTFSEVAASSSEQPSHSPRHISTKKNLVDLFTDFQQSSAKHHRKARGLVHLIDDHLPVEKDSIALAIVAAGLLFFFVSLFCFIISSQPPSVWVSTTVVVVVTFIILRIILGHQQPGFWRLINREREADDHV